MKNTLLLLIALTGSLFLNAQESRKQISGKIFLENYAVSDAHIINKTTKEGTISNDRGEFKISIKKGDTLYFSHLNLAEKELIITAKTFNTLTLIVSLEEKSIVLNEVFVKKRHSIFYQDKSIGVPIPIVNAKTLKLPYANTKIDKDQTIVKFRSGFTFGLDGIVNRLSGQYKREKKIKALIKEDKNLVKIRKHFTDDFFVTDLQIKKEYINQFLNFCVSKNIISHYKQDDQITLTEILIEESKIFPNQKDKESTMLSKN